MTLTVTPITEEMRDFSAPRTPITFRIDGDVFTAMPALPALTLIEFADTGERMWDGGEEDRSKLFAKLFRMCLTDESAERFVDRLTDRTNPIDINQVNDVVDYLMERYGLRPTVPSGSSSAGSDSPDAGTRLTVPTPVSTS